jgi:hypothetical protein
MAAKTLHEQERALSIHQSSGVSAVLNVFQKGTSSLHLVRGPGVTLDSQSGFHFNLFEDGQAALRLADEKGASAILGSTTLERKVTAVVEQCPASSL